MIPGSDADAVLTAFSHTRELFYQARSSLARIDDLRGATETTGRRIDGAADRLDALTSTLGKAVETLQRAGEAIAELTAEVAALTRAGADVTVTARLDRLAETLGELTPLVACSADAERQLTEVRAALQDVSAQLLELRQEHSLQRRGLAEQDRDLGTELAALRHQRRRDREVLDQLLELVQRLGERVEDTARHGAVRDEAFQDELRAVGDALSWRQRRRLDRRMSPHE